MLEPDTTVQADLRGGHAPWLSGPARPPRPTLDRDRRCGVLIVGAGITGALMAEHLTSLGHNVCVIDRERPGFGSTAASTSLLQWEIDCPLVELTKFYGFERAANLYRHSVQAVAGLKSLVGTLGVQCAMRDRLSLYIAAGNDDSGARALLAEHALRARAGLPGDYLDYPTLLREFAITREAAILSPGSADADPLCLAHGMMAAAAARGAALYDAEAVAYDSSGTGIAVLLDNGHVIEAEHVVLATGYVMPDFIQTPLHKTSSSWAIATPPQRPGRLWRDGVLIWEASEHYLYARTTADRRIIIGGEDDESLIDPDARDAVMPQKSRALLDKLKLLWPNAEGSADYVWSGAFGETADGLPLIGAVPGHLRLYAAYGYGGNGITFSYLASRLIGRLIAGHHERWYDDLAIDRPVPAG